MLKRGHTMKPLKRKISLTVDEDILIKIKKKAEEGGRSLSQYINLILKKHIDYYQYKYGS